MDAPPIALAVAPMNGKPQRIVEARAGDVFHRDNIDTNSARSRRHFIAEFAGLLNVDVESLDSLNAELVQHADAADAAVEHAAQAAAAVAPSSAMPELHELDATRIVRPEQFITPEVIGYTMPLVVSSDGAPAVRWQNYRRWKDGRRECRLLDKAIELPSGQRLLIHPTPALPSASEAHRLCGWSTAARKAWLQGTTAPNAAAVFQRICDRIAHFVELDPAHAAGTVSTLALWSMLSYCYSAWPAVPYLFIGGPQGSGKSRIFEVFAQLVFRPLGSSNLTAAAMFRMLHDRGGTLLLDEAERLRQGNDPATKELLSILLAGYKRGGQATRLEPVGDSFRPVAFDVFGPKALACIAGLPSALASRCIRVTMFRAPPESDKPRRRVDADATWRGLRDDLHALALEHGPTFLELAERADVCPAMSGRDYELWQPLLALAAWVESHGATGLRQLVEAHALTTIDANRDDSTPDADELLLRLVAGMLRQGERPQAKDVLQAAREADPELFKHWSATGVGRTLVRYGLQSRPINGHKLYMPEMLDVLRRVQASYGIDLGLGTPSPEGTPRYTKVPP